LSDGSCATGGGVGSVENRPLVPCASCSKPPEKRERAIKYREVLEIQFLTGGNPENKETKETRFVAIFDG
jgi:hypothetical protein